MKEAAGKRPSVLIVGSGAPGSLENSYLFAMRGAAICEPTLFDVDARKRELPRTTLVGRVLNRLTRGANNVALRLALRKHLLENFYDVVIIFKGMEFSRQSLEEFRSASPHALWVNINPDDPFNIGCKGSTNSNVVESLSFFDIYCTWSRRLISRLKEHGCRQVLYLPFAYDAGSHRPPSQPAKVVPGRITFVGAWDKKREEQLTTLVNYDLRIYGESWRSASRRSPLVRMIVPQNLYGDDLARVTAQSAVSLNLMRPQNDGSHNMRTFEIPAMGGLMLTTRSIEQQELFPENEASLMFSGVGELREKVDWVIAHPEAAAEIRRKGHQLVRDHTYVNRAHMLIEELIMIKEHVRR